MFDEDTYKEDVSLFKKIDSKEADQLLDGSGKIVVYIGRETCPYCRKFAKKLSSLVDDIDVPIYYVNSSDSSDDNIESFRGKYNIATVPGFLVSKEEDLKVRCDSSLPESEILQMINE
ncbi:MAG: thiol reductase thioredoxin [Clostridium sp.]|nr:thiol reductase thioredoxin [Clostridium sp.]